MKAFIEEQIIPHELWRVTLDFGVALDGLTAQNIAENLEDTALSVMTYNKEAVDGDNWRIVLTVHGKPDVEDIFQRLCVLAADESFPVAARAALSRELIDIERIPEEDWLLNVHRNFPPVTIGQFFVYGSHYEGEKPQGLIPLHIDAATAFGSGEHETTSGCMQALQKLKQSGHDFKNILDMGCGSGILAIAAAKMWPQAHICAVDIDPESIIVTRRHADLNGVYSHILTEAGDGYHAPLAQKNAPYNLVTANILAGPLVEMAPDLTKVLAKGGIAILSGLLSRQKEDVTAAHAVCGLTLLDALTMGEWQVLVLQK